MNWYDNIVEIIEEDGLSFFDFESDKLNFINPYDDPDDNSIPVEEVSDDMVSDNSDSDAE